jgi:hypothetical protein
MNEHYRSKVSNDKLSCASLYIGISRCIQSGVRLGGWLIHGKPRDKTYNAHNHKIRFCTGLIGILKSDKKLNSCQLLLVPKSAYKLLKTQLVATLR